MSPPEPPPELPVPVLPVPVVPPPVPPVDVGTWVGTGARVGTVCCGALVVAPGCCESPLELPVDRPVPEVDADGVPGLRVLWEASAEGVPGRGAALPLCRWPGRVECLPGRGSGEPGRLLIAGSPGRGTVATVADRTAAPSSEPMGLGQSGHHRGHHGAAAQHPAPQVGHLDAGAETPPGLASHRPSME